MYGIIRIQEDLVNCEETLKLIEEGDAEKEECVPYIIASLNVDLSDIQRRIQVYMAEYEARIAKLDEKKRAFCKSIRRNNMLDKIYMLKEYESDVRRIRRQLQKYQRR